MAVPGFLTDLNVLSIIVFLAALGYIVWRDRENIERYSIVFVRRTEHGIDVLNRVAQWSPVVWRAWSTLGIVVGFAVMAWIFFLILGQTLKLFLVGGATPPVGPVLPTVSTVTNPEQTGYLGLPFWHFLIGLSVVLVAHEMMHGVIARVEGFSIRSVGLLLLGIIPGAFVQPEGQRDFFEPSDADVEAGPWGEGSALSRLRVLAAGPFANITLALLLGVLLYGAFTTAHGAPELRGVYEHEGMQVIRVANNSPAAEAGLEPGMVITGFGGAATMDAAEFQTATQDLRAGQEVEVETRGNGTFMVVLGDRPETGNVTFRPAPIDYVLPLLEQQVPGTIAVYEDVNDVLVADDVQLRIARWEWIGDRYPGLAERSAERVAALQPLLEQDEEGYLGIVVVPDREVAAGFEPYVAPVLLVLQLVFIVALLNLMIGAANLLPIKGLDGGWMVSVLGDRVAPAYEQRVTYGLTMVTILMIVTSFAFLLGRVF